MSSILECSFPVERFLKEVDIFIERFQKGYWFYCFTFIFKNQMQNQEIFCLVCLCCFLVWFSAPLVRPSTGSLLLTTPPSLPNARPRSLRIQFDVDVPEKQLSSPSRVCVSSPAILQFSRRCQPPQRNKRYPALIFI